MSNKSIYDWSRVDLSARQLNDGTFTGKITLVVGGIEVPISKLSMTYAINDIPTATAILALGRDARTGQPSNAYKIAKTATRLTEAYIKLEGNLGEWEPRGDAGFKYIFPYADNVTLFKGYVGGISYTRSSGKVALSVNLVNQLVTLSMSMGGTDHILPSTPLSLIIPLAESTGIKVKLEAASRFTSDFKNAIEQDFCLGLIKIIQALASDEYKIQTHEAVDNNKGASNLAAKTALESSTDSRWLGLIQLGDTNYLKGAIEQYLLDINALLIENVIGFVSTNLSSSIYSVDIWSTLVSVLLPSFGCALVPFARTAAVVPILPMYKEAQVTLKSSEYADFSMTANVKQPVRAVGILCKDPSGTAIDQENPEKFVLGGAYIASEEATDGGWFFKPAPGWCENFKYIDLNPDNPEIIKVISEVSNSSNGDGLTPLVPPNFKDKAEVVNSSLAKYAKQVYAGIALRGRQGSLVGKLRFDISPGSTIKFELSPEEITGKNDLLSTEDTTFFYGFVNQVTISIDAEQGFASTSFMLSNLRNHIENSQTDGLFSMTEHPFFNGAFFKGASLIPELDRVIIPND